MRDLNEIKNTLVYKKRYGEGAKTWFISRERYEWQRSTWWRKLIYSDSESYETWQKFQEMIWNRGKSRQAAESAPIW